ncbi:unnamed protein product [Gongylonema pulchrum]|uniref:Integrator complex subunit 7 n=1 Tax=Gongylonema pulchrum TaxID=637853 RepID=A0A183E6I1_9BILA|nr:unnamed protein product [Gongylonema pulchrum]
MGHCYWPVRWLLRPLLDSADTVKGSARMCALRDSNVPNRRRIRGKWIDPGVNLLSLQKCSTLVGDVRLKCISALLPLHSEPRLAVKLELFTNKFKDRLVSMVMDKDCEVAVRACQLLTALYRIYPAVLTLTDCVPVYELVYCNQRALAQAAGEFHGRHLCMIV